MIPTPTKSLKLDAEVHDGVHFHVAATSLTSEDLVVLLGTRIEVVLGIGPDRLYLGVGGHALAALKEAITKSKAAAGEEVPPLRIAVAGTPLAAYAAATLEGPDKLKAAKIANLLKKSPAQDHATLTVTAVPRPGAVGNRRGPVEGPGPRRPHVAAAGPDRDAAGQHPPARFQGRRKGGTRPLR